MLPRCSRLTCRRIVLSSCHLEDWNNRVDKSSTHVEPSGHCDLDGAALQLSQSFPLLLFVASHTERRRHSTEADVYAVWDTVRRWVTNLGHDLVDVLRLNSRSVGPVNSNCDLRRRCPDLVWNHLASVLHASVLHHAHGAASPPYKYLALGVDRPGRSGVTLTAPCRTAISMGRLMAIAGAPPPVPELTNQLQQLGPEVDRSTVTTGVPDAAATGPC